MTSIEQYRDEIEAINQRMIADINELAPQEHLSVLELGFGNGVHAIDVYGDSAYYTHLYRFDGYLILSTSELDYDQWLAGKHYSPTQEVETLLVSESLDLLDCMHRVLNPANATQQQP